MKRCPKCDVEHEKNGRFCSPSCANSRTWTEEDKKKKSESAFKYIEENGTRGSVGKSWKNPKPRTTEHTEKVRAGLKKHYDLKGRRTEEEKRAKNVSGVQAYRQKKYSATPPDVNRQLIRKIYENCPDGYEVDHIVALCNGGPHHQDNLQYLPAMENRRKNRTDKYDVELVIKWQDLVDKNIL